MSIYRERFAATLAHQPVDRCPIDLSGCPQATVLSDTLWAGLAAELGLVGERPAGYAHGDQRVVKAFDADFRRVGGFFSFSTGREHPTTDGFVNEYGMRYRYAHPYADIVESPLDGASIDDIAAYEFPTMAQMYDPGQLDHWEADARYWFEETPYVIVAEHPVWGVLEMACWLCGYGYLMEMLALEPESVHLLFSKILAFQQAIIPLYYARVGRYCHITTSGDDFGTQRGPFMSPAMFREYVKPYFQQRIAFTRQYSDAIYLHHSCGSIFDIIPDLAEIGVGILNPIQPVAHMAPEALKAAYGDRIVFHGGLDTQEVLPANDPQRIDAAVENLLAAMRPQTSGGYIFAAAHNLQDDVPPSAVTRMFQTALRVQQAR
jgi:uroporphyrinogen decarboxylase